MGCGCGGKKWPKQQAVKASAEPAPKPEPKGPAVWNGPQPADG